VHAELLSMSSVTINRYLRGAKARDQIKGKWGLTLCVGHAQSQEWSGGSEMIQPDGKEKLSR
jgi:hypothetical protein